MSDQVAIDYTASPTLGRFLGCDHFVRLIVGPVGSGKSSVSVVELLRRAREQARGPDGVRHSRAAVVRNTYRQLEDTTIKTFEQWVPPALGRWRAGDNAFDLVFEDVACEILFRALDRPDDIQKLLSLELTFSFINEAREVPRPIFDLLLTRLGRYPAKRDGGASWRGLWMDSNPCDTDHWLYKLFEEEKPDGYRVFHQPGGRAPDAENLEHLDRCWDPQGDPASPEWRSARALQARRLARGEHAVPCGCYYPRLARGKAADPDWVKVYVDGQYGFVKDGKPIYPEWNDQVHTVEVDAVPGLDLLLGSDFGLTPAAVLGQRDPSDGQLQIFDELVSQDMGAVNFARILATKIKRECPGRAVGGWGDPAGEARSQVDERTPFDVVQAAGLPISPAPTNDFTLRREAVAGLLTRLTVRGRPALVVSPRCKVLRKAMGGAYCYRRLQVTGDRFADKPDKNPFSHVAEALQYLAVGEGEDQRAIHGTSETRRVHLRFNVKRAVGGVRRRA